MPHSPPPSPRRLLVMMPSWVGDAVMATPTLRALREQFPDAHIAYLVRAYVRPVIDAAPWHDQLIVTRRSRRPRRAGDKRRRRRNLVALIARLRRDRFDTAILLPNSFRSAMVAALAGVGRRVGYDRDGRGLLLTDRLLPVRELGRFVPTPLIDYYLGLAGYLGADCPDRRIELFTRPEDDHAAEQLLRRAGALEGAGPRIILNPGAANHGDAKLWPADRFAAVADALAERHGATVLLNGSPRERPVLDAVRDAARRPLIDLPALGSDLTLLKSIVRRCDLMICNDTGGRHIAAALGTAVVSLFGPTDPQWTRLDLPHERILIAPDSRMASISVEQVLAAAERLLAVTRPPQPQPP